MADELKVAPVLPVQVALARVSASRPVCFTPMSDSNLTPASGLIPVRLVRVVGPASAPVADALSLTELLQASVSRPAALSREVVSLYLQAARTNRELCGSLLAPLGAQQRDACGH